jgi:hypothetical protein
MWAGGGIDGSGIISSGAVSAFGSIVVNGTRFDTSEADIIVNGEQGVGDDFVLANLDIGRVVTVEGTISQDGLNVTADRVVYSDNVAGPVTFVGVPDPVDNDLEIEVMGQIVVVNFTTKFKPDTYDYYSIAPNDMVTVSGYLDDTGAVRATFIENTGVFASGIAVEVKGHVMNLQDSGLDKTFEINNLTVNYTSIAGDLPQGIPAEDQFVEETIRTPTMQMSSKLWVSSLKLFQPLTSSSSRSGIRKCTSIRPRLFLWTATSTISIGAKNSRPREDWKAAFFMPRKLSSGRRIRSKSRILSPQLLPIPSSA